LSELRVEEDVEMPFSKNALKKRIDEEIEKETQLLEEEWDLKLSKDEIKLYIKRGGSEFDTKSHYSFCELRMNDQFSMKDITEALYNKEKRLAWDKNIVKMTKEVKSANSWLNY
jgi:hypothetical protein